MCAGAWSVDINMGWSAIKTDRSVNEAAREVGPPGDFHHFFFAISAH